MQIYHLNQYLEKKKIATTSIRNRHQNDRIDVNNEEEKKEEFVLTLIHFQNKHHRKCFVRIIIVFCFEGQIDETTTEKERKTTRTMKKKQMNRKKSE